MRRVVVATVVLGFAFLIPGLAFGQEDKSKDKDKDKTPPPVNKDMKPEEVKPPKTVAPPAVGPCEQIITCYRPVLTEKEIKVTVNKMVPREEKFTYTAYETVIKDVKRIETFYVPETKPIEYTKMVLVPVTEKVKKTIRECSFVNEPVTYKYIEMVPTVQPQKRIVCYTEIVKQMVETTVPVCTIVQVPTVDCCGNCCTVCQRVVTYQKVMREVCVPVKKTKEVMVNATVCVPTEKVGTKIVCKPVYTDRVIECEVTKCVAKAEKVQGVTCVLVAQTREVMCKVPTCVAVPQTGVRRVFDCVPEVVTRKVQECVMVPYQVKVPVGPCCNPCW